ncbi:hypothetical protein H4582DRAFT_2054593 [Lactarius indigo]|nr:hypothetical protein H4582DRAFT_2054593 [Lactarius indigo]
MPATSQRSPTPSPPRSWVCTAVLGEASSIIHEERAELDPSKFDDEVFNYILSYGDIGVLVLVLAEWFDKRVLVLALLSATPRGTHSFLRGDHARLKTSQAIQEQMSHGSIKGGSNIGGFPSCQWYASVEDQNSGRTDAMAPYSRLGVRSMPNYYVEAHQAQHWRVMSLSNAQRDGGRKMVLYQMHHWQAAFHREVGPMIIE